MKKFLLSALAFGAVMTSVAMEPLTPEQLSKLEVNVSNYTDGSFCLSSKVGIEYFSDDDSKFQIQNFIGSGKPLTVYVDWENATVSATPYIYDSEYDYDTYQMVYYMVVNDEAANLSSPMDQAFNNSKVTGTISETSITLENWNMVKVSQTFDSMTKMYDKGINTEFVATNAEMTLQLREADIDQMDDDTYICPIVDTYEINFRTYVKDNGNELLVYNWDDMQSCVKLYKDEKDGKITYATKADEIIYTEKKRQFGIYPFDDPTDEFMYDIEAAPFSSEPVTVANEIDFGYWIIYSIKTSNERTLGRYAKLKLDFDLDLGSAGDTVEPLTPEQLEKLQVNVSNYTDGSFCLSSHVSLEYSDASNPTQLKINNFIGDGLALNVNVDWENGTIVAAPYVFDNVMDYDTYEMFYLMVVNEEAANLSSPMDPAFNASKVYGTISESGITLDNWNIVKVNSYFSSMTKMYDQPINTEIVATNADMTLQLREADWEQADEDYNCPIVDTYEIDFRTYVKDNGDELLVYNWDDMASCVKLYKEEKDGKITYATKADEIIYTEKKRQFGIYPFDDPTDEFMYDIEAAPFSSEPVTVANEIDFGYWIIYSVKTSNERTLGRYAKLKLDFDLNLGLSGIADAIVEAPVKVAYYTLTGIQVANPQGGIFVKVATYADGKTIATKVAM